MVENLAQLDAKEDRKLMMLSIGDGADDVAMPIVMIQEVNVGCGLLGHAALKVQTFTSCYARGVRTMPLASSDLYDKVVTHTLSYQRIADMHNDLFYKVCHVT